MERYAIEAAEWINGELERAGRTDLRVEFEDSVSLEGERLLHVHSVRDWNVRDEFLSDEPAMIASGLLSQILARYPS